ncbi:hypothetical protein D320_01173 [Haloferax sp. BAB-2207]|nr:hypothetical protein D320_01173 [Haloferax sp. BAB-2207]
MKHRAVVRGIGVGVGEDGSNVPAVVLEARDEFLPIVITSDQAQAIQLGLSGEQFERPLTHDLLVEMVTEFGGQSTASASTTSRTARSSPRSTPSATTTARRGRSSSTRARATPSPSPFASTARFSSPTKCSTPPASRPRRSTPTSTSDPGPSPPRPTISSPLGVTLFA